MSASAENAGSHGDFCGGGAAVRRARGVGESMSRIRTRALVGTIAAALVVGVLAGSPAAAEDEPDWQPLKTDVVGDVTVTWESALVTDGFGTGWDFLDPVPYYRPDITNDSAETKFFAFATDFGAQGVMDHLWLASAWEAFADYSDFLLPIFWAEVPAGMTYGTAGGGFWQGMPAWSGHTVTIYELDADPRLVAVPGATPLSSVTTGGRFVPIDLSDGNIDNLSAVVGQRLSVVGGGDAPELFPGVAATVTASGLPPGETLELWAMTDPDRTGLNYAFFHLLGSLLSDAIYAGSGVVGADGVLRAYVILPDDIPHEATGTPYQLVAGVRAERYWPAGTWDDFLVKDAPNATPLSTSAGTSSDEVMIGDLAFGIEFADAADAGTSTVTVSPTGPEPSGFSLAGAAPFYFHISSTVSFGTAIVCIGYDEGVYPGAPPHLFHFDTDLLVWEDITRIDLSEPGIVCGETDSFSPFALGYLDPFDFTGFFDPVSNDGMNLAKAGQAIPVKFSLGGDQGLDVITSTQFSIDRTVSNPSGDLLDAVTAGKSSLSYDAASDQYTYVWKTNKTWANKQGHFVLTLSDGSVHEFEVTFKK